MKKLIVLLVLSLSLLGCGKSGKPDDISQEMYDTGIYALNVIDRYLDGEADRETTDKLLDELSFPDSETVKDLTIKFKIDNIGFTLFDTNDIVGKSGISDVKEERDELADLLNYDE